MVSHRSFQVDSVVPAARIAGSEFPGVLVLMLIPFQMLISTNQILPSYRSRQAFGSDQVSWPPTQTVDGHPLSCLLTLFWKEISPPFDDQAWWSHQLPFPTFYPKLLLSYLDNLSSFFDTVFNSVGWVVLWSWGIHLLSPHETRTVPVIYT